MPPRPISTAVLGGFPHPFPSLKMFHQSCHLGPNLSHEVMDGAQLDMKMCHPGNQTKTGMFKNVFEESTGWQGGGRGSRGCFSANAFLPPFFSQTLAVVQQPRERNIYMYFFFGGGWEGGMITRSSWHICLSVLMGATAVQRGESKGKGLGDGGCPTSTF